MRWTSSSYHPVLNPSFGYWKWNWTHWDHIVKWSDQSAHSSFESQEIRRRLIVHFLSCQNCYHYQQTHGDLGTKRVHLWEGCYNNCSFIFRFLTIAVVFLHLQHPLPRNLQWWRYPTSLVTHPRAAAPSWQKSHWRHTEPSDWKDTAPHASATSTEQRSGQHSDEQPSCSLLDCRSPQKHNPPCSPEKQLQTLLPCKHTGSGTLPSFCIDGGKRSTLQCLQRWRQD